jgi:hypothetical protein
MNTKPKVKSGYYGIKIEPKLKAQVEFDAKRKGILPSEWIRLAMRAFLAEPKAGGKRAS